MPNLVALYSTIVYISWVIASPVQAATADMVLIPSGCFQMGTKEVIEFEVGRKNIRERPIHKVCLDAFHMDKYEVTQKQWEEVFEGKINIHQTPHHGPDLPVDFSKWEEATEYCSKKEKRLPTEAEWEYAARAGSKELMPWGKEIDSDYVWYEGNSVRRPHPVGSRKANAWGLHDMIGSVWEWVADWYSEQYYQTSPKEKPKGPITGSWRVIRGASWRNDEKDIRSGIRERGLADATFDYRVGFRCAKDAKK